MSIFDAYVRLDGTLKGTVKTDEDMSKHTTYRIGGPADLFIECASVADLALTCDVLREEEVDWVILGNGSNVLVSDNGFKGAVLILSGEFASIDFGELEKGELNFEPGSEYQITAGAAVPLPRLVQQTCAMGLSGLECAVGIPGTFGGALFMNAGSADDWIGSRILTLTYYKPGKGLGSIRGNKLDWGYRSSGLTGGEIIVEATLTLNISDEAQVSKTMQERLDARNEAQPISALSCGSVFKNPQGGSASKLIEDCGLKGARCGDAQISDKHSNFIVNTGTASAEDVLALIQLAHGRVEEKHGVSLTPEVKFLGFPL